MRTFLKKLPFFFKNSILPTYKISNLKYELFIRTPFLGLLETPALRAALHEAYPPNSRRQSSSEEDDE